MTEESPFAAVTHPVDPELARRLAELGPRAADAPWCREFAATMRKLVREHLDDGPGYFVLTGMTGLDERQACGVVQAVSALIGSLLPQDPAGALTREVRDRGSNLDDRTARYSDTRHGGNLHTDGMHRPGVVPSYFALFCVRPSERGGELVLVRIEDVLRALADQPELVATLRAPVHFDTRNPEGSGPRTVPRPIVETTAGRTRVHYLREYIESGHRHPGVEPLRRDQLRALDAVDELLDRPALQSRGRLESGELIVIDNRSIIHGRTTFHDSPGYSGRLMLRTWIAEDAGAR